MAQKAYKSVIMNNTEYCQLLNNYEFSNLKK